MNLVTVKYIAICIITSVFSCTGKFKERYIYGKKLTNLRNTKYILYMFFERSCKDFDRQGENTGRF